MTFDLTAATLRSHPVGEVVQRILAAGLAAVDPEALTVAAVREALADHDGEVVVAGGGKAGAAMARGIVAALGDRVREGVVVVKQDADVPAPLTAIKGAHPVPDASSVAAAEAVLAMAGRVRPGDVLVCPISGGGSALMCAPEDSLDALQSRTDALLKAGATIEEINRERAQRDRIKAGGLARAAGDVPVLGLILSDVISGPELVASGPTWLDAPHVRNVVVGSNDTAVQAAAAQARAEGCEVAVLPPIRGEAKLAGIRLGRVIAEAPPTDAVRCTIVGGETTVTVTGRGRGGRNQELVLAAAPQLLGCPHGLLVALATDGEDGPTDAAGAVASATTIPRAIEAGLDPAAHLADNNAYALFDALDDLLRPGPTGTNVCDLAVMIS